MQNKLFKNWILGSQKQQQHQQHKKSINQAFIFKDKTTTTSSLSLSYTILSRKCEHSIYHLQAYMTSASKDMHFQQSYEYIYQSICKYIIHNMQGFGF